MWFKLLETCIQVSFSDEPDRVSWLLANYGVFLVKYMYSFLIAKNCNFYKKLRGPSSYLRGSKSFVGAGDQK
jgi:hypothetical protein